MQNTKDMRANLATMRGTCKRHLFIVFLAVFLCGVGCAHRRELSPETVSAVYYAHSVQKSRLAKHAPLFLVYGYDKEYNRIGRPKAKTEADGDVEIYIDPGQPVFYTMERRFAGRLGEYRNLIYRVHFSEVPFSLFPFHLTAGGNVGLIVVVTLDQRERPVLVTTVHTCGCYLAVVPTTFLPEEALPEGWKNETLEVYGEKLPPILDFRGRTEPKLVVSLRPEVHRVTGLSVVERKSLTSSEDLRMVEAETETAQSLEKIPLDGSTVDFYYRQGFLNGHVKGSVKPWETLLLSLISLDLFVGTDKAYDDTLRTGNPFYTSIKPWNRRASDMWYFSNFLEFWGWRL